MNRRTVLIVCMLLPVWSTAGIEKTAVPTQGGMRLMWWPKVVAPEGWHLDTGASRANAINVLVPNGANFGDAETVIYARAIYKPRDPGVKTLQTLIDRDQAESRRRSPDLEVKQSTAVTIADGTALNTYTCFPGARAKGNWEAVAYGEDGDFYLMFVVSSRSEQGYEASRPAYEKTVASYTREPKTVGGG